MQNDRHLFIALFLLSTALLCCGSVNASEPTLTMTESGHWRLHGEELPAGTATLSITDGQSHGTVSLSSTTSPAAPGWISEGEGVRLEHRLEQAGELTVWSVTLHNTSDRQRWLEPAITLRLDAAGDELTYWDGGEREQSLSELTQQGEAMIANSIKGRMPLAAVHGSREGVALGLHPLDLFSYSSSELHFPEGKPALRFAVRTVLEPGSQVTARFVLGTFDAHFGGQRAVIQTYHDAFPVAFTPNPQTHRYLRGASSHYHMHHVAMNRTLETMRRFGATWEWVYTPFKRTGDEWGYPELWDYKPFAGEFRPKTMFLEKVNLNTMSREDFFALRERYFNRWGQLFGLLWYSPAGSWVEKELALQRYPDAQIQDPSVRYELSSWVTGHDKEVLVLPWFTSYEPVLREDYRRIAETYDTTGIAMDVARGGPRYRGPAIEKDIPTRAYDEQGMFIDQGVAVAKFIDYLHTLPVRFAPEQRLGVIGNPETGGHTFITSVRFDAGMYEGQPYHHDNAAIPNIRYTLGQKPLTWWKGWGYNTDLVPDWRDRDREHFVRTMNRLVDYVVFQSYKWAATPTANYQWGIPQLSRHMPLLLDTIRLGWQARFPVDTTFDGVLYSARYGKGVHTRLFWGNPYEESRPLEAVVHNRYLGSAGYVFADLANPGVPVRSRLADGLTHLDLDLPSRAPVLHQAVAGFVAPEFAGVIEAVIEEDFASRTARLHITPDAALRSALILPRMAGFELHAVLVDGQPVGTEASGEGYQLAPTDWTSAGHTLEARYRSTRLHLTADQLAAFRFLDEQHHAAFTVVAQGEDAARAAERIRQFFELYLELTAGDKSFDLRIVEQPETVETPYRLVLAIDQDAHAPDGVSMPDAATLLIRGQSFEAMDQALLALLATLEQRFPSHPPLRGTWGTSYDLLKHYDLLNKNLPEEAQ